MSGYGSNGHVLDRYSWLILWLLFGTGVSYCWILTQTWCLVGSLWSKCLNTRRCSPDFGPGINTWTRPIQSMRPTLKVYGAGAYHSLFMEMKGEGRARYPSWFNPFRCWLGPKESKPPTSLGGSKSYWQPFDSIVPKTQNRGCFSSTRSVRPLAHPRHSMCSRLLSAMMPANMYAGKGGEKTWESLANFLLKDLTHCFHNGVEEPHLNIIEFYCHKPKLIWHLIWFTWLTFSWGLVVNPIRYVVSGFTSSTWGWRETGHTFAKRWVWLLGQPAKGNVTTATNLTHGFKIHQFWKFIYKNMDNLWYDIPFHGLGWCGLTAREPRPGGTSGAMAP